MGSRLLLRIIGACLRKRPALVAPSAMMLGFWWAALAATQVALARLGPLFRLWLFSGAYLMVAGVVVTLGTLVALGATAALADDVINGRPASVGGALARARRASGRLAAYAWFRLTRVRRFGLREPFGIVLSLIVLRRASPVAAVAEARRMDDLDAGRGTGLMLAALLVAAAVVTVGGWSLRVRSGGWGVLLLALTAAAVLLALESLTGACIVNLTDPDEPRAEAPPPAPAFPAPRRAGGAVAGSIAAAAVFAACGVAASLAVSAWAGPSPRALCPADGDLTGRCVTSALLFIALRAGFPIVYLVAALAIAAAQVRARTLPDPSLVCAHLAARIAERAHRLHELALVPLTRAERLSLASTAVARSLHEFPPLQRPALRRVLLASARVARASAGAREGPSVADTAAAARRLLDDTVARRPLAPWAPWVVPLLVLLVVHAASAAAYRVAIAGYPGG